MNATSMEAAARSGSEPRLPILAGPFELLRRLGAKFGPYVLLELLLPGGTMFALLLFLYRRRKPDAGSRPTLIWLASPPALVSTVGRGIPGTKRDGKVEERACNAPLGTVRSARACARPESCRVCAQVSTI